MVSPAKEVRFFGYVSFRQEILGWPGSLSAPTEAVIQPSFKSEHWMFIDRLLRYWLDEVPMFHQPSVLDPKDVHDGSLKNARFHYPAIMERDQIIFGD